MDNFGLFNSCYDFRLFPLSQLLNKEPSYSMPIWKKAIKYLEQLLNVNLPKANNSALSLVSSPDWSVTEESSVSNYKNRKYYFSNFYLVRVISLEQYQ